jgi:hypothetical protein
MMARSRCSFSTLIRYAVALRLTKMPPGGCCQQHGGLTGARASGSELSPFQGPGPGFPLPVFQVSFPRARALLPASLFRPVTPSPPTTMMTHFRDGNRRARRPAREADVPVRIELTQVWQDSELRQWDSEEWPEDSEEDSGEPDSEEAPCRRALSKALAATASESDSESERLSGKRRPPRYVRVIISRVVQVLFRAAGASRARCSAVIPSRCRASLRAQVQVAFRVTSQHASMPSSSATRAYAAGCCTPWLLVTMLWTCWSIWCFIQVWYCRRYCRSGLSHSTLRSVVTMLWTCCAAGC